MKLGSRGEIKQLSQPQRTLFDALRRRYGNRLGVSDAVLLYAVRQAFVPPGYAPGKSILRIGDYHDLLTLLAAGTAKVTCEGAGGQTVILQMVTDGHAFGLPSLAGESEPRRFGAVAHSAALIGVLGPDALRNIIARLDTERRLRLVTYGWSANTGLLLEKRLLLSLSVPDRIRRALWSLAARSPAAGREAGTIAFRLTHEDLAQLVGASRSTVCRSLVTLARKKLVFRRRGRYVASAPPPLWPATPSPKPSASASVPFPEVEEIKDALFRHLRDRAGPMGFRAAAIQAFADNARFIARATGESLALADGSDALMLLLSGAAGLESPGPDGKPMTLLFVKPGHFIVGAGVSRSGAAGPRAVAHVDSYAAILSRNGLGRVLEAMSPGDLLRFLAYGWRVFSHHHWSQCQLLTMNHHERVLHQLTHLAADFPTAHADGTVIDLPLSRTQIGRLVAASDTRVSHCLSRLEKDGHIAFVGEPARRVLVRGLFVGRRGPGERCTASRPGAPTNEVLRPDVGSPHVACFEDLLGSGSKPQFAPSSEGRRGRQPRCSTAGPLTPALSPQQCGEREPETTLPESPEGEGPFTTRRRKASGT